MTRKNTEPAITFDLEGWLHEGQERFKVVDKLNINLKEYSRTKGAVQWEIGDWLIKGEGGIKTKTFKPHQFKAHALKLSGYNNWGSLENLMTTARQVPESRRRDGREGRKFLPFALHVEVGGLAPEVQESLLKTAEERPYSVRDFKKIVAGRIKFDLQKLMLQKQMRHEVLTKDESAVLDKLNGVKHYEQITLRLAIETFNSLAKLADAKYRYHVKLGRTANRNKFNQKFVADLLFWMAMEYFTEHKPELTKLVADHRAELQAYAEKKRKISEEYLAKEKVRIRESMTPEARAREQAQDAAEEIICDARAEGKAIEEARESAKRVYDETYASYLQRFTGESVPVAELETVPA